MGESAQGLGALCKGFRKGGTEQYVVRGIRMHSKHNQPGSLAGYLTKIARLGGYMARARDPPPENMVM